MKHAIFRRLATIAFLLVVGNSVAFAQATRTWVSGVGDDANPCSRTAPCKTFAGAISKTAAGGEISVLDPGGFGAVTITKAITISGTGTVASILASGTTGIIINAGVNDVVTIRDISIHGGSTALPGQYGIRFLAGRALHVDRVSISGFTVRGIQFTPSGDSDLYVNDSIIHFILPAAAGGILVSPTGSGTAFGTLNNVKLLQSNYGLRVEGASNVSVTDSVLSGNTNNGALVYGPSIAAQLTLDRCTLASNGSNATTGGIKSEGGFAKAYIHANTVSDNSVGLLTASGGQIVSSGGNTVVGNGTNGAPTSTVPAL